LPNRFTSPPTTLGFIKQGGRLLIIEVVPKYVNWSGELKKIYDGFPDVRVIFTVSSALDIYRGEADLTRRVLSYSLHGLSFREYLAINQIHTFQPISLKEIVNNHRQLCLDILEKVEAPLLYFKKYLRRGYLPFGTWEMNEADYLTRLYQIVDAT